MRLVKDHREVKPGLWPISQECIYMGQHLMDPPSVEGWHTGQGWIDSGNLVGRVNFVADRVGNIGLPGVKLIVDRMLNKYESDTVAMPPDDFVDGCLDLMGPVEVREKVRNSLIDYARNGGPLNKDTEEQRRDFAQRVGEMLQLIAATGDYQYA